MNDFVKLTLSADSYNFLISLLTLLNNAADEEVVDIDDRALTDLIVEVSDVG